MTVPDLDPKHEALYLEILRHPLNYNLCNCGREMVTGSIGYATHIADVVLELLDKK